MRASRYLTLVFVLISPHMGLAQTSHEETMLGVLQYWLEKCRQAEPRCNHGPDRLDYMMAVEKTDVQTLYRGGCIVYAHSARHGMSGGVVGKRSAEVYREMVAISAARAVSECGECPTDEFWGAKIGKDLLKSGGGLGPTEWQRVTQQCRPEPEPVVVQCKIDQWRAERDRIRDRQRYDCAKADSVGGDFEAARREFGEDMVSHYAIDPERLSLLDKIVGDLANVRAMSPSNDRTLCIAEYAKLINSTRTMIERNAANDCDKLPPYCASEAREKAVKRLSDDIKTDLNRLIDLAKDGFPPSVDTYNHTGSCRLLGRSLHMYNVDLITLSKNGVPFHRLNPEDQDDLTRRLFSPRHGSPIVINPTTDKHAYDALIDASKRAERSWQQLPKEQQRAISEITARGNYKFGRIPTSLSCRDGDTALDVEQRLLDATHDVWRYGHTHSQFNCAGSWVDHGAPSPDPRHIGGG